MIVNLADIKEQDAPLRDAILEAIEKVISSSSFIKGPTVASFEEKFAKLVSAKHCIGVGNGTDALFLALKAFDIKAGDEVITAANTFIATAEAISMTGAKPVFVDCDPESYNLDVDKLERSITSRTRAIIPVHLYGQPARMDIIMNIARRHACVVIEDAAQAHGAKFFGSSVGSIGDCGCFSFFPGKNLGAYGDAGAVVTNDDAIARKIRMYANHGRLNKYDHEFEGVNSRLDSLQAAILEVKLAHLERWTTERRCIARLYSEQLKDLVTIPTEIAGCEHVFHLYVLRVKNRDRVRQSLSERGISTGVHYPTPLPLLSAYKRLNCEPWQFEVAEHVSREILSLPIYGGMSEEKAYYVISMIRNCLENL